MGKAAPALSGWVYSVGPMTTLRIRQAISLAVAVLGFVVFALRSLDPDDMVGEWGFLAVMVGGVGTLSLVIWTAVPGIARVYAMGWADRDERCSCSSEGVKPRHLDVAR